jgi:hypothetical protein
MMCFMDAIASMQSGNRVMRNGWLSYWLQLLPHQNFIWSIPNGSAMPQVNASIYIPSIEDINATDWIVTIK